MGTAIGPRRRVASAPSRGDEKRAGWSDGRGARLLLTLAVGAVALWPAPILIGLWRDERFVRAFQERERITIRPEPRFRPRRGPANGRTPHDSQQRPTVPVEALDETDLIELVRAA